MHLNKEDLPPTLVGVLDLERLEGFEQGFKEGFEKGMKQIITGLIEKVLRTNGLLRFQIFQ
ncbi:hypothetical protein [Lysinibacillus sp. NPDC092081]|uniref:hypothetical protein n=1 Tax=Lysinibacillus sp. NPDC092081 TaxID=3364131 RepID=UPI00382225CD